MDLDGFSEIGWVFVFHSHLLTLDLFGPSLAGAHTVAQFLHKTTRMLDLSSDSSDSFLIFSNTDYDLVNWVKPQEVTW